MALVKCKECKKEVSNKAKICPNCGVKDPAVGPKEMFAAIVLLLLLGWGLVSFLSSDDSEENSTAKVVTKTPEQLKIEAIECRANIDCWGPSHRAEANIECDDHVEQKAAFSFEWTNSFIDLKFPQYRWLDQAHGWVTYRGDSIKLQNQYGAWANMTYECDFDPSKNLVISVRMQAGKL